MRSAVCWGGENTCSLELLNQINVGDVRGLHLLDVRGALGDLSGRRPGEVRGRGPLYGGLERAPPSTKNVPKPLQFLVKRLHRGIQQQRGQQQQEAPAATEAPEGRVIEGRRSAWQPGRLHLWGHHHGVEEGEGHLDNVRVHSPQQAGNRKHPVLLCCGSGGW